MVFNTELDVIDDGEEIKNEAGVNVQVDPQVYNQDQETYYSTIKDAVEAAENGDIILVGPGTYQEDVTINKALTLLGAK